ncbi:MAG: zf-HC2 domain-containing protein [Sedimentisphaerales bacterium]|nr:zf-HC2 domain-containing protein [Sedimentisphaerales bacterium]
MDCTKCKELLIAYAEGLLDESPKQTVAEHLNNCPACRAEADELSGLQQRLVRNGKAVGQSDLENNVMNLIVREQNARLKAAQRATEALKLRRKIMKSPITKIAAAAVILIAVVLIGLNPIGNTVTFAKVVEPILNAKTVILDMIIGDESGPTMHEIVVDSRIRRTMSNLPNMVQIIDLDGGQMLALDTEAKTGSYISIEGQLQDATKNYVAFLKQIIRQVKDGKVEKIGEQVIDGQKAIGFVGKGQNEEVTIWADPKTAHPIRIELRLGQMAAVMKNLQFDTDVDPALVSMDIPEGYTEQKANIDLGNATEQDFIASLRIWAEVLGDGVFPEQIGTEATMKQMPALIEKLKAMNISEEEGTKIGMTVGKGMMFHQFLETGGADWHYAGAGVKLGDASKPIFWYQPKGSQTYRVISGDLSVKDVAPDNLPK